MCARRSGAPERQAPSGAPASELEPERLQKALARAGIASRRKCEELIRQGRVKVNGTTVTEMGRRVRLGVDELQVDGRPIQLPAGRYYYVLYKPVDYLSAVSDARGRRLARDLVPGPWRLYPVGRLDLGSEGLLLFTDDGELAQRLTHPRYGHEKEYLVLIRGRLSDRDIERLARGVPLPEKARLAHASVKRERPGWSWKSQPLPRSTQWVRVVLREGRKRQIRRLFKALGHHTVRLVRVRMGIVALGDLEPGQGRWLDADQARSLRQSVGLDDSPEASSTGRA